MTSVFLDVGLSVEETSDYNKSLGVSDGTLQEGRNEFEMMKSRQGTVYFNDNPPSEEELAHITTMRTDETLLVSKLLTNLPLIEQPENVSDWKLLRFLRGYENDPVKASKAFVDMAAYREKEGINELRGKLVNARSDKMLKNKTFPNPNRFLEYKNVVDLIERGLRYDYGFDLFNRMLTVTDIGSLDLKSIIEAKLEKPYFELCILMEEYSNLVLHELTVKRGRLVARHDVIVVSGMSLFQWDRSCLELVTSVLGPMGSHYPESVVKITSAGNGKVAVIIYGFVSVFIPARTKEKLTVLGYYFVDGLLSDVALNRIPLAWGGIGAGNDFDKCWAKLICGTKESPNEFYVKARNKTELLISLPPHSKFSWDYSIAAYSIGFSISFAECHVTEMESIMAGNCCGGKEGGVIYTDARDTNNINIREINDILFRPIVDSSMNRAEDGPFAGSYNGEKHSGGIIKLIFDNSHSWLRSKYVSLHVDVETQKDAFNTKK